MATINSSNNSRQTCYCRDCTLMRTSKTSANMRHPTEFLSRCCRQKSRVSFCSLLPVPLYNGILVMENERERTTTFFEVIDTFRKQMFSIALIVIPLLIFRKLLKKWVLQGTTHDNTSSPSPSPSNLVSASASALGGEYEVFLSFCGKDTRKGFTDYLYSDLVDNRIRTFKDDNELRVGEDIGNELIDAIKDSKVCIPIFSRNYASSKWCLRELAQIVECHTTEGQLIIPVFYDVEPSDVRHQTGSYREAFRQHRKSFDENTVQGWKEALAKVGKLKGLELKKETNGLEGQLVKMVVEKVLSKLRKNYKQVIENLVGMDHHFEEMKGLLDVDSYGVRIVGIHGMGGIGKTTIAKFIYNQLCERFERCCFLQDVRETLKQHNGLFDLQNQLISKIGKGKGLNISNVDDGINRINDSIRRKKVFIVLDDVDEKSQFDKLAGNWDMADSGSRIIVTTRNKEVLDQLEVTCQRKGLCEVFRSYEPQFMSRDHSLQLFSNYAFIRDLPPEDYHILSKEVVSTAAGLPLVLVIMGSLLLGKDKDFWEETLLKLKEIPHKDVMEKLRISFKALEVEQKEIFLDIACFFIGEDKAKPFYMWEDCRFYPRSGINVLVLRSLVKIGDDNRLWMHDQLRDLGRLIVHEENLTELRERSRLWRPNEALDIVNNHNGTERIVALSLSLRQVPLRYPVAGKVFEKLPNLRYLRVDYGAFYGDSKQLFSKLRWLELRGFSTKYTLANCNLKNLVILNLSHTNIADDWEGWSHIKMAKNLKHLDLSHCEGLRVLDFSTFATLESLNVSHCYELHRLDGLKQLVLLSFLATSACSIERLPLSNLKKLKTLETARCKELIEVQGLDKLKSLEVLNLSFCESLDRLPDLSNLKKLKKLNISGSAEILEIQGLGRLESLELLSMSYCPFIERFPDVSNLRMLKELHLRHCSKLTEVEGLVALESLELLDVNGCVSLALDLSNLKNLKKLIINDFEEMCGFEKLESLESLTIWECKSIEIPDMSNFKKLKKLVAIGCLKLIEMRGLEELKSLEKLDITCCESIEKLPDISNLKKLRKLRALRCRKVSEIRGLVELKSLVLLDITQCESTEKLLDLSNLRNLKEIKASGCVKLPEICGLEELKFLEELNISGCKSIEKLPDFANLGNLEKLEARGCVQLTEIRGLEELKSLKLLDISGCKAIEELPDLSNLGDLKKFKAGDCVKLTEIQGLEEMKCLELLDISGCESIEKLPDLSNLQDLEEIKALGCVLLTEIPGLEKLICLESLDISGCESLEKLPDLSKLQDLDQIKARGCMKLTEIRGLGGLEEYYFLKLLDISGCETIEKLPDLSNLKDLKQIKAGDCVKLTEIRGLEELKLLEFLGIAGCESVEILPDLSNLQTLKVLIVCGCVKLNKIRGLEKLKSLEYLDICGSGLIGNLPYLPNIRICMEDSSMACKNKRHCYDWKADSNLE